MLVPPLGSISFRPRNRNRTFFDRRQNWNQGFAHNLRKPTILSLHLSRVPPWYQSNAFYLFDRTGWNSEQGFTAAAADWTILEGLRRIESKLDDMATISRAMSTASPDFTRALLGDKGIRITTLPLCDEIQDPTFQNRMYTWGENEDEKDGQPRCKQILEEELLPLRVDDRELGIFDVRGMALPEVREGGRKSNGFSDLAIGDLVTLSAPHTRDLTFNLSPALIELETGNADLKPGQLLLQLVSLSAISNQRRGVVVLGTDCATKWRLVYFSKFDTITIQQYTCGKKCLADFTALLKSSPQNGETLSVPPRLPRVDEMGFEQNANQEPSADLNAFAAQLAGLFPSERESLLSVVEDGHSSPPPMINL